MTARDGVLIVGGGLAAARTALALRALGHSGPLRLLSEERDPPYDRPPLSKAVLLGTAGPDSIGLLSAAEAAEQGIELLLGRPAAGLDIAARRVALADGDTLRYDVLVIATGARPRRLAALGDRAGVHHLRTLADAQTLRAALLEHPRVAVVGGGFIGLEVAAAARTLRCAVTVLEAAAAPLATVLGAELGALVCAWHEEHGVAVRCGVPVRAARGNGRVEAVELADGSAVAADVVIAGLGVEPAVGWIGPQALEQHRGVVVDEHGRTSATGIYALGDAACRHTGGRCVPGGHWTGTNEQALRVAAAIVGRPDERPPGDGSYFWSDQHDTRLQFAGQVPPGARVTYEAGSVADRAFLATCRVPGDSAPCAVFAMGAPRAFVRRRLEVAAVTRAGATAATGSR